MIRAGWVMVAALMLTACKTDRPTATVQTSPAGIEYTLISLPGDDDVSIQIAWDNDWAYRADTQKAAPIVGTHLILAGGAAGYRAGEAGERFADIDAEGIIYSAVNDQIIGELTFPRAHLEEAIGIANAHLRAPILTPIWFDRMRSGIAETVAETQTQPLAAGFDALVWAVLGDQPLRQAIGLNQPDPFATLTRSDIVAWHAQGLTRDPAAVVIAGGIAADQAGAALDDLLAGLMPRSAPVNRAATADFRPRRILLHRPEATVTTLALIAPLPATAAGSEMEDLVIAQTLGGDDQSILFTAMRTDLRASYGFEAGFANYSRAHRFLYIAGEVETGMLAQAETALRAAYADLRRDGPAGPLDQRKAALRPLFADLADFVIDQARSELQSQLDGFAPGRSLGLVEELDAVTQASVMARLQADYPASEALIVVAVSADADALPGACVITAPRQAAVC